MHRIGFLASSAVCSIVLTACALARPAAPQAVTRSAPRNSAIPTPESVIGHGVGVDYKLVRWETIVGYFEKLGAAIVVTGRSSAAAISRWLMLCTLRMSNGSR